LNMPITILVLSGRGKLRIKFAIMRRLYSDRVMVTGNH
jgi:hypothetical protein